MSAQSPFVHLHVHSEYSLLDGAVRIDRMLEKCKSLGMESVAITDHGNMFGAVEFFEKSVKMGIKPIIGCEVYVAPGDRRDRTPSNDGSPTAYHLILLTMNEEGYRNLSRLVTLGNLDGFYYRPRVDMEILKEYNKGLIAFSACLQGIIPYNINMGNIGNARAKTREMASIFDNDRFYLEVQANLLEEQAKVNDVLKDISRELSIPMVATNDCHYLNRADAEAHDALLCIQTGKTVADEKRLKFSLDEFYFKTRSEMEKAIPGFGEALDNTVQVAARCSYEMEFGVYKPPVFSVPENMTLDDMLTKDARDGLEERLAEKKAEEGTISEEVYAEYRDRLEYEIGVITKMGFSGYFLIVADFIEYARKNDIPVGPGRGSAAGSLVAFCQKITNIDPIKYGLIFERFLNPGRISMPDIDVDFCIYGRDEVIRYVSEKYGRDNVSQIITFGTMKAKGAIRDVGRVLNIPLQEVDKIAKLVPDGSDLETAYNEVPEIKTMVSKNDISKKLFEISRAIEGMARHASTHASGVVISDKPLVEHLPLYKMSKGEIMTQFTMDKVEQLGLIKFDFLGLKTLTVIKKALNLIEETTHLKIDIDHIPLDDEATYQLCAEGRTTGVFQLESSGMQELLRRLKPGIFEDLIGLVALYRPGPLGSGMVDDFINGKHGKIKIKYFLPQLAPVLKETYGIILYQEQAMKIAQIMANYTMSEADELRKAIGKKKPEVMAKHRQRFSDGAVQNNINPKIAETLFSLIEKFGGYGFNKSHSAAYALVAFQTAYLKAHYPVEFMAALLTQDMGNQDKTIKNIAECRDMGIEILPPDINESQADFSVVEGKIRFGLAAVKNVGMKAVESIIEERINNGVFKDLLEFCKRIEGSKVNKRVLEGLIQCGALDFTGIYRSRLFAVLDEAIKINGSNHDSSQMSMFADFNFGNGGPGDIIDYPEIDEWEEKDRLKREKEALGFYITGHPLERYRPQVEKFATCAIQALSGLDDKSVVNLAGVVENLKIKRTKRGNQMAVFSLEDMTGAVDVVIFPDLFSEFAPVLKGDAVLLVSGNVELNDGSAKIIAQKILTLDSVRQKAIKAIELRMNEKDISKELLEDLQDLVYKYSGDSKLRFVVRTSAGEEISIAAGSRFNVFPCNDLISGIETLTGIKVYEEMKL